MKGLENRFQLIRRNARTTVQHTKVATRTLKSAKQLHRQARRITLRDLKQIAQRPVQRGGSHLAPNRGTGHQFLDYQGKILPW